MNQSPVAQNLSNIRTRITSAAMRSQRQPADIKLVAVSKTVEIDRINQAIAAGITILGENRVQEAESKIKLNSAPVSWHLIGHLQTNKAKKAVALFQYIHSVDSVRVAEEINTCAHNSGKIMPVLLQINISGEESKSGISMPEFWDFFMAADQMANIKVEGFMTIPPFFENPQDSRPYYAKLRNIMAEAKNKARTPENLKELSMGMTNDFEVAIEEGATFVRIGTAIFGSRA